MFYIFVYFLLTLMVCIYLDFQIISETKIMIEWKYNYDN